MTTRSFSHLLGRKPRADDGAGDGADAKKREEDVAARETAVKEREDAVTEREQDVAQREGDCAEREGNLAKAEDEEDEAGDDADGSDGGNEEDDGEMKKAAAAGFARAIAAAKRSGRRAERKRCAEIFAAPQAKGRVALAATLAFNSGVKAADAIATLAASPRDAGIGRLDPSATRVPSADALPAGAAPGAGAIAASWAKAFAPYVPKR